ncbi:hypothetical protein [Prolixibacter denitrificans]|uniref:Uncharacterized protein n=1 Tax=Prolixibacter denitrificans TaxID=1541063 RepID=A0A2P8C6B3_9BACT|nr:hypothetical protein [Prolixibacter denitrificans]PSK80513.1 hypothetical protein CLV93_11543 [Prolixibacter denitrificans]GET22712.1 hypothetical protein JCM18694_29580 [Prolixibacter denitrificans]
MILLDWITRSETWASIFKNLTTGTGIIVGGIWTYRRFYRQREHQALIDFSVDIVFHEKLGEWWIVELNAYVENKGKVQHKMNDFKFKVESLSNHDVVELNYNYGGQVNFPTTLSEGSFLPKKAEYFFIEPGLKNKYSFITRIPASQKILLMHSWFNYYGKKEKRSHIAEVTKVVPEN